MTALVRGGGADGLTSSPAASAVGQDIEDLGLDADFSDEEAASISSRLFSRGCCRGCQHVGF